MGSIPWAPRNQGIQHSPKQRKPHLSLYRIESILKILGLQTPKPYRKNVVRASLKRELAEKSLAELQPAHKNQKVIPKRKKPVWKKKDPCFFPRARGIVPSLCGRTKTADESKFPDPVPETGCTNQKTTGSRLIFLNLLTKPQSQFEFTSGFCTEPPRLRRIYRPTKLRHTRPHQDLRILPAKIAGGKKPQPPLAAEAGQFRDPRDWTFLGILFPRDFIPN